jgi:hypothetical protein
MISARGATTPTSEVAKQLDALGNPLLSVAVDAGPLAPALRQIFKEAPPQIGILAPSAMAIKTSNLTWDLDGPDFLKFNVRFNSPDITSQLFGMAKTQFDQYKTQFPMTRRMFDSSPTSKPLTGYLEQIVNETKLTNTTDTISLVIPKIKNLDQLPVALKPALDAAAQAATETTRKNDLKQIGLAMHNYHDSYSHFPASNGSGEKGRPVGLSWRVQILPYIDQAPLYTQFKLDEPWDSPHNKQFITKMPAIFGANPEGKTSIHVFSGPGTGFDKGRGPGMRDITDGTSSTIMVVRAGDDTAEIWTKPSTLVFDPKNPLKCLGSAAKEFQAILFDGTVRTFKAIDPETFSKAVRINDGSPVQLPD